MMSVFRRSAAIVLLACGIAPIARAQQLPTSDQARRLLETRPDLVAQLRREIANSGLTPDQIRARLRANGYPDDLLDAYIAPSRAGAVGRAGRDTLDVPIPTDDVLDAVAALGISDSLDTSELKAALRQRRAGQASRDTSRLRSLNRDSLGTDSVSDLQVMVDSLGRLVPVRRPATRVARGAARPDSG